MRDRIHTCDCSDRTETNCPRHGAVAPREQESAEALADVMARHCVWSGGLDESAVAAVIELDRVCARADERREALEDACRAVCSTCKLYGISHAHNDLGYWYHSLPGCTIRCMAQNIRALMEQEKK